MPTLAAFAYRHHRGLPFVYPENELSYCGNFLNMLYRIGVKEYKIDPRLERALDILFILHADHEQNCSATTMRVIGSAHADPYSALAGLHGRPLRPLHGGANEAVLRMLTEIGSVDNIPDFMESVRKGERRLMGFGHRVYKSYDPRASIIKRRPTRSSRSRGRTPSSTSRWSWRRSPSARSTSSSGTSTRTWTSTRGSSTRPWASRWRCSRSSSPFPAPWGGWPSGRRC
jgi:citrate synthase